MFRNSIFMLMRNTKLWLLSGLAWTECIFRNYIANQQRGSTLLWKKWMVGPLELRIYMCNLMEYSLCLLWFWYTWRLVLLFPSCTSDNNITPFTSRYYLLYGHTCCFCAGGSGAEVSFQVFANTSVYHHYSLFCSHDHNQTISQVWAFSHPHGPGRIK